MGYRNKDGTWHDSCLDKVRPHEPIFVLRAQDKLAPRLVRLWGEMAADTDCPVDKIEEAFATADEMEQWPDRKFPD